MPDVEKRLRYFNGQFLQEQDFTDEQAYHIDRQRRHNRTLHTPGIAEGLNVTANVGATAVQVSSGTAIDNAGNMIVLDDSRTVDIVDEHRDQTLLLVISYNEGTSDPATVGGGGDTRIHERPNVELLVESAAPSADTHIRLARLVITSGGTVSQPPDESVRTNASVRLGGQLELNRLTLSRSGVDPSQWPILNSGAANRADLSGNLRVSGNVNVEGTIQGDIADGSIGANELASNAVTNPKIANNAVTADKIADGNVGNAELANNAVTNPKIANSAVTADKIADGNVGNAELAANAVTGDKVAAGTINQAKFDAATQGRLVTNGDSHDHSGGDGATVRHSALNKDDGRNPHGATAADVGALPIAGGTIQGSLIVTTTQGNSSYFRAGQPFNGLQAGVGATTWSSGWVAGVEGQAFGEQGYGVAASSSTGTYALYVSGTARFTGAKTGYVVDVFINAGGERLRTGDVVKLKGTPIQRFQGDENKIPVAEVTLADKADDNMVIGIVDREVIPEQGIPDSRIGPEDPTFIESGGELFVVTLGTYAHCRVDATAAPIAVGDLLTTSGNPGHARKATEPKIGTIIGKALEPLAEGTGYIAVFVNIQ
jgi:hypothetical protein